VGMKSSITSPLHSYETPGRGMATREGACAFRRAPLTPGQGFAERWIP